MLLIQLHHSYGCVLSDKKKSNTGQRVDSETQYAPLHNCVFCVCVVDMDVVNDGLTVNCLLDYHGSQHAVSISACLSHRRENEGRAGFLSW